MSTRRISSPELWCHHVELEVLFRAADGVDTRRSPVKNDMVDRVRRLVGVEVDVVDQRVGDFEDFEVGQACQVGEVGTRTGRDQGNGVGARCHRWQRCPR